MKKLSVMAVIMVMASFLAGDALANEVEDRSKTDNSGRYEMMMPGDRYMMEPGMMGQSSDDCWMGKGMMYGHHYGWMHGGFIFVKLIVVGFFFWLLFSIHKSLKVIADSKVTKE